MRNVLISRVVLVGLIVCGGCGGPTLDASSEETLKTSSDEMMKSMDADKRAKFEKAIGTLMMSKVLFAGGDEASMKKKMKETFDGKSADDVIAEADKAAAETNAEIGKMMQ